MWLFVFLGALIGAARTETWAGAAGGALQGLAAWFGLVLFLIIIAAIFGRE